MKIIKPGAIPEAFWWLGKQFSCKKCGCVFELEKGDFVTNVSELQCECPTCKTTLRLRNPLISAPESIFDNVFGNGGIFDDVFGKPKT